MDCKKSYKKFWIIFASITTAIAIAISVYFIFFRKPIFLAMVGRAVYNIAAEAEERIDHSPVKAAIMLGDVLKDGTVKTDFVYSTSILGNFLTVDVIGEALLSANLEARNFALEASIKALGTTIELDANMNKERLALRLPLLDNNYYGITYDTFRDDVRVFGQILSLSDDLMDGWADYVDILNRIINTEIDIFDEPPIPRDSLRKLIRNLEVNNRRSEIISGEERINCRLIEIKMTKESVVSLLYELYDILEGNESAQALFLYIVGTFFYQDSQEDIYRTSDDFPEIFNKLVTDIETYYTGDIVLSFYIGSGDRLLRAELNIDAKYDHHPKDLTIIFDFGSSIEDDWKLVFDVENFYTPGKHEIIWSYDTKTNNHGSTTTSSCINNMILTTETNHPISVTSEWNIDRGGFVLTMQNEDETVSLEGLLRIDDNNFHLRIDDLYPDLPNTGLKIELSTQTGAQINDVPTFINLDKWSSNFIESLIRLVFGGIFS